MNADEKKREIILKTTELMSLNKGSGMTTRKIAKNAGINPAMVNYYFGSKDGLIKAAIASMIDGRPAHENDNSRKAMFDYLVDMCETAMKYSVFGIRKDATSFSNDVVNASSALLKMKLLRDGDIVSQEDSLPIFRTVSFLMTASSDPDGFLKYSGIDIYARSQLRIMVSEQLDILLGDSL